MAVQIGGEGRNRTRTLDHSMPNALYYNENSSFILQGFKHLFELFGDRLSLLAYCP